LGEYQTRARKISTSAHKQQAQQWGKMGKCPETGHRGDRIKAGNRAKSKHGAGHRQGLNLWLGKANEATASQH